MDQALRDEVVARLELDESYSDDAKLLVLAACEGEAALDVVLGGGLRKQIAPTDLASRAVVEPPGAYVSSIAVEGFRGIGSRAELDVDPRVGLTLVVGRNGSGKSSFAEALEVLLTGDNQRWAAQSKVWKEGWRNLHHENRKIEGTFAVEGQGELTVQRTWAAEATEIGESNATAQVRGRRRGSLDAIGWNDALISYRPFLSYNELGRMLDEGPSILYDALASILGLEDLVSAQNLLGTERRMRDKALKEGRSHLKALVPALQQMDDERATRALELSRARDPDVEEIAALATGSDVDEDQTELASLRRLAALQPRLSLDEAARLATDLRDAARALESVAATASGRAKDTADLLDEALAFHAHHGDGDCPVCGTSGALTAAWQRTAKQRLADSRAEAADADEASRAAVAARAELRSALEMPTFESDAADAAIDVADLVAAVGQWTNVSVDDASLDDLAGHVEHLAADIVVATESVASRAAHTLADKEDAWRPLATQLAGWVEEMRAAKDGARYLDALERAENWVKATSADIRAERFKPLADQTKQIWSELRAQSNVDLVDVVLSGTSTQRRVDLEVTVDGFEGAALGVMSQGELHSLALSLFFPRATLPESPFRFVVIDDPVQSMDPVRVDRLARVLEEVAKTRQVVVFTHDDRLPSSLRALQIDATILEVTRRARSDVEVRPSLDPVSRYVDDCRALLNTDDLPTDAAARVVPGMCRLALEAAFLGVYRSRSIRAGVSHVDVEDAAVSADKTTKKAALALFGDVSKTGDVMAELNKLGRWAGTLYKQVQAGSHTSTARADLEKMVSDTRDLARRISEKYA